ncbi:MAG: AmmeMemoRadiSam system radical SAM enzyme [Gemmatimonadota bacterium]
MSSEPPRDRGASDPTTGGVDRRTFVKRGLIAAGGVGLGVAAARDLILGHGVGGTRHAFLHDAPASLPPGARPAAWWDAAGGLVHCRLCPHLCVLADEDRGFCRARAVKEGTLYTLVYGNPCSVHVDPVEKKPLYHFLPGQPILSLATAGCNLRCLNCQNWEISQARPSEVESTDLAPETVAEYALRQGIPALAYTYTEPLVFYEYTRDTSVQARRRGLRNVLVSAGYVEEAPLRQLCAVTDAANVDLKSFDEDVYRELVGGSLKPVLRCLEVMKQEGVWLEVTRLVVPGHSDDLDDLRRQCDWMAAALGPETPLHLSRFHPAYRLQGLPPTPEEVLDQSRQLALEAGLHHVYVGNVPGHAAQDTQCAACGRTVVRRQGYHILENALRDGRCPCGVPVPGVWL